MFLVFSRVLTPENSGCGNNRGQSNLEADADLGGNHVAFLSGSCILEICLSDSLIQVSGSPLFQKGREGCSKMGKFHKFSMLINWPGDANCGYQFLYKQWQSRLLILPHECRAKRLSGKHKPSRDLQTDEPKIIGIEKRTRVYVLFIAKKTGNV